jgi:hypothetical protein
MQNTEMLVKILKDFCRCRRVDNYGIITITESNCSENKYFIKYGSVTHTEVQIILCTLKHY